MLTGPPYGRSVDWWCLGILDFRMMTGRSPFDHQDEGILFNMIQRRQLCTPSTFPKEFQDIIKDLMEKEGEEEIQDHPFFFHINWTDLGNGEATPPFKPTSGDANIAGNFLQISQQLVHHSRWRNWASGGLALITILFFDLQYLR
jgi:serine/threonine protein kinase